MPSNLLIDFGATRTKSALLDLKSNILGEVYCRPSAVIKKKNGTAEIEINELQNSFADIVSQYGSDIENILLSCQMHGFALTDKEGGFLTDYISWQDERGTIPFKGKSSFDLVKENFPDYRQITGMRLRAGFPVIKILDILRKNNFKEVKVLSLGEILAKNCGKVHSSMAQASGCFDIKRSKFSKKLTDFIEGETSSKILFNEIVRKIEVCARTETAGKKINIWTGVGDHQASVLGAGNNERTISINIGTGSQVSQIEGACDESIVEKRCFFEGKTLNTITHIPAGRVISEYMDLLGQNAWEDLSKLTLDDLQTADLDFNLAIFKDAFGYDGGGAVKNIKSGSLTNKNFTASLLKSFAMQYVNALNFFENGRPVIISGGKLAKLQILKDFWEININRGISVADTREEALNGLKMLS